MLECVVKHNEIDAGIKPKQFLYAGAAVLADGHGDVAPELLVNLVRLVAYVERCGAGSCQHEPFGFPFVSPRQHADVILVAQQVNDIFRMWSLACAAGRDIAHHHHRHRKFPLLEYVPFEHKVAHSHRESVDFRQREQQ